MTASLRCASLLLAGWLCLGALPAAADEALDRLLDLGADETAAGSLMARWPEADGTEALVAALAAAVEAGAPVDLMLDKAAEGLAKNVPPARLLPALRRWGGELAAAATLARQLHEELDPGSLSERETVLRLHLLRRTQPDSDWIARLRAGAVDGGVEIRTLLGVGEAVARLQRLGLSQEEAVDVGYTWLASGVRVGAVATLVRAIEVGGDGMPVAEAARQVTERAIEGWSADEVLAHMDRAVDTPKEDADAAADAGSPTLEEDRGEAPGGIDGRDLPAARDAEDLGPQADRGREVDEDGREAEALDDGRDADGREPAEREQGEDIGQESGADDRDEAEGLDDGRQP